MNDDALADGCAQGSAALALFGIGTLIGVMLTPLHGLARTGLHALWHPGCVHR